MKDSISPEEKLLQLIRGQKRQEQPLAVDKRVPQATPQARPTPRQPGSRQASPKFLSQDFLNKAIVAGFVLAGGYLAASFFYSIFGLQKIKLPEVPRNNVTGTALEARNNVTPVEFYLQSMRRRTLFISEMPQQGTGKPASAASAADAFKDINIVGIISGDNPQVVIEDKKTQKTYYVTKGQSVGEFLIEDIQEGKVIINYKSQKYELYL